MDDKLLYSTAAQAIESGDCRNAYHLLKPLIDKGEAEALFLYSKFALKSETDEEFERRSVACLERAAEAGYAPAMYSLGVCYDSGELVEFDSVKAANLFEQASKRGYGKAKLSHGLNLFYGSSGVAKDVIAGMALIRAAVEEGVEDAIEFLRP